MLAFGAILVLGIAGPFVHVALVLDRDTAIASHPVVMDCIDVPTLSPL
jgi:hypothetical protein